MTTHITDLEYVDDDRRVAIYRRSDSKAGYWQARFRIEGQRKYKRVSTGKMKRDEAERWALREYTRWDVKVRENGEALIGFTFNELATKWIKERETQHARSEISDGTLERDKGTVRRYLKPYFGKKKVGQIKQADLDDYREWRDVYWTEGAGKGARHKHSKTPTTNTIRQENSCLRMILKRASELGHLRWETLERFTWTGEQAGKNRREHFAEHEWKQLTDFMRRKEWLENRHTRVARDRKLLRDYVLVMKNTGMRVGEQRYLRWRDIQERKDRRGNSYWVCMVDGKQGKRTVVCNDGTERYFERIKELTGFDGKDDWVWAKQDGSLKKDFGNGFRSLLRTVFGDNETRTLYSIRHTYATLKIINEGLNVKILAEQMGTSVNMLDKHYGHVDAEIYGEIQAVKRAEHELKRAERSKTEV